MNPLEEVATDCPYCNESIPILVDTTLGEQEYIEDCYVCCQPIILEIDLEFDSIQIVARSENE